MAGERCVYIASPLRFADSSREYLGTVMAALRGHGFDCLDPWDDADGSIEAGLAQAEAIVDRAARVAALAAADEAIGRRNAAMIERARGVFAVLDGVDVDSGTASEIGFAAACGLPIVGLRTDWRRTGDNEGCVVNLQVEYFIRSTGGAVFRQLDEAAARLAVLVAS
ncbi:MAG: nucleoside 2-deoxyribosyltransferase [Actinobacteria bacterium]|nr:nucleoside 2-deoxyribosyltransferase [Actinomycetota bacterium]